MVDADPLVNRQDIDQATAGEDWPSQASQTVVRYVGTVRDKTTGPLLTASRNIVYIAAMALIAVVLLILILVLMVRVLVSATGHLPFIDQGETWLAYFIIGGLFLIIGTYLWRKKESR